MAHEIRKTDNFAEVRSNGQRAWHGLGIEIPEGLSAVEATERAGLGWKTDLLPVYADRMTADGMERIESPKHRLHVRRDTGGVLGLVSDSYSAVENIEAAAFADALLGEDAAMSTETVGSLFDGKRFFVLMRMPRNIVAARGDELATYVAVTNGHGGTAAFAAYPTSVRIVCNNTLRMSEADLSRGARFIHSGDVKGKMQTAQLVLGFAQKRIAKLGEQVEAMARTQITGAQVKQFMADAFAAAFPRPQTEDGELLEKWLAKRETVFAEWRQLFTNERNAMESIRGSVWQAFNTVTEWHDHGRGRTEDGSDARIASNLFGVSHEAKQKTLKLALALV